MSFFTRLDEVQSKEKIIFNSFADTERKSTKKSGNSTETGATKSTGNYDIYTNHRF